ncbi:MAG: 23S rRNA (adenine(2503)-C(2))-methyltransferase RlmN [Spirochaetales bacterium]|nr:23S rRNA (adenine(2503)-C(2))-methyltransferase RlmN [Spirochaetales bacterium]
MKEPSLAPLALSGLEPEDLAGLIPDEPAFRGTQIFQWIHRGVSGFQDMTDLPKSLRETLNIRYSLHGSRAVEALRDQDGTVKYRFLLSDGCSVEAVILTDEQGRKTACLSTQAGCAMGCAFCRTGAMGFKRNLTSGEIIDQFSHGLTTGGPISNIVFMGMGEPFLNEEALYKAIRILTHPAGPALSARRITVSSCGIAPAIRRFACLAPGALLAVSVPTAVEEKRQRIMPGASRYPLEEVKAAMKAHQAATGDRITVETVLFGGFNTSEEDGEALLSFIRGLQVVVNLIPFNPFEGTTFREPSQQEIETLAGLLHREGIPVTRRYRRGRGILGACGQLAT